MTAGATAGLAGSAAVDDLPGRPDVTDQLLQRRRLRFGLGAQALAPHFPFRRRNMTARDLRRGAPRLGRRTRDPHCGSAATGRLTVLRPFIGLRCVLLRRCLCFRGVGMCGRLGGSGGEFRQTIAIERRWGDQARSAAGRPGATAASACAAGMDGTIGTTGDDPHHWYDRGDRCRPEWIARTRCH